MTPAPHSGAAPLRRALALCALSCGALQALPGAALAQSTPGTAPAVHEAGFDCRKAQSPVERAICASAEIAEADRAMAIAYRALLQRSQDPDFTTALKRDQQDFIALRARAYDEGPRDAAAAQQLLERTELRAEALNWWHPEAADSIAGTWANLWGQVEITQSADGVTQLRAQALDQLAGRWLCGHEGELIETGPGAYRARTLGGDLVLRLRGATLELPENYCDEAGPSAFGSLQGVYFRVGAPD